MIEKNIDNFNYQKLSPFKWFVLNNFPFLDADFDAMTEWQLFQKLGEWINKIIDSQNYVGSEMEKVINSYNELYNYVDNYFKNLDLQEEVNNKLNEMVEDGTLTNLLATYMPFIFPEMYGAKGDDIEDDTNAFITAINEASSKKKKLYLSNKTYKVNAFTITLSNDLNIEGNNTIIENTGELVIVGNNNNNIEIKNITIKNGNTTSIQNFNNINLENYNTINQNKFGILISNSNFVNINNSKFIENGKNLSFSEISGKGMAIFASTCSNVNVNNSYFEKNWGQSALRLSACNEININNNKFVNNMFRAIELPIVNGNLYNYNGKISNNYIIGCGYQNINPENDERTNGIFGNGADGNVDVINNIIINSQENGIEGYFRHIKGNIIDGTGVGTKPTNACAGASVRCSSFENNTIKNTLSSGLSTGGDGTNRSNTTICNNTFENIGQNSGIYYGFTGGGNKIENLSIMNNICNNRPIIGWSGNISNLSLSNVKLLNNKGIGLLDTEIHSVLPLLNYDIIDEKEIITKNNLLINWNDTNKPENWDITSNGTVSKITDSNQNICKIDGIAYNTYISQEFELNKKLNETLYEIKIIFKGTDVKFYLDNIGFDNSRTTVYQNRYVSKDSNNFTEYKLTFRPYKEITTGKLILKVNTSSTSIEYKEITLSKFYQ